MSSLLPQERARRQSNTEKVLTLFRAHPMRWLHWRRFEAVGGACAWRTRISEARRIVKAEGGTIENNDSVKRSAYRYLPYVPLARSADIPAPNLWPVESAPYSDTYELKEGRLF